MEEETQIKVRCIYNLAHTVEVIWEEVMGGILAGSFDISRVWDMNRIISELRSSVDEVLQELK